MSTKIKPIADIPTMAPHSGKLEMTFSGITALYVDALNDPRTYRLKYGLVDDHDRQSILNRISYMSDMLAANLVDDDCKQRARQTIQNLRRQLDEV